MDGVPESGSGTRRVRAPAKINLSLHVVGKREDGYHLLDGLVVFTELGDELAISPAAADRLVIDGPMAEGVPLEGNIVVHALALARQVAGEHGIDIPSLTIALTKNLPSAAGIGGGSADAAALLRHLGETYPALQVPLAKAAARLGADVPMCLTGAPSRITGIGEAIEPLASMPPLDMVLVNPRIAVPTPAIFARLRTAGNPPPPAVPPQGFATLSSLADFLKSCRNDLSEPAESLAPVVIEALASLRGDGALLSRMSGSGATVFGLFGSAEDAKAAAAAVRDAHPHWWVEATRSFGSTNARNAA